MAVDRAPQIDDRRKTTDADSDVDQPPSPGPAEGVGDDHTDSLARCSFQQGSQAMGRAVRIHGEQDCGTRCDVRSIDCGIGTDEPMCCLGDDEVAATSDDLRRLRLDEFPVRALIGDLDDSPFLFRHDLVRHHDDVVLDELLTAIVDGCEDHRGEVIARLDLWETFDREDAQVAHDGSQPRTASTHARPPSGGPSRVSAAMTSTPNSSPRPTSFASAVSTTSASRNPR